MNKRTKRKLIRVAKGSISVMLCLVITPFLTIAACLVEMYRYQTVTTSVQELVDLCSYSALADYDPYLLDRFGLMALSQNGDPSAVYQQLMSDNLGVLGQAVTPGILSTTPANPLSGSGSDSTYDVIRNQITDFSETTVLSEFAYEELNIDELMDKLNDLTGLSKVAEAAEAVAGLASSVEALVSSANNLITSLQSIKDNIATMQSNYTYLNNNMYDMIQDLSSSGFELVEDDPSTPDVNERDVSYDDFIYYYSTYLDNNLYYSNNLNTAINNISTALGNLPTQISALKDAAVSAKEAAQAAKNKTVGSAQADQSTQQAADPLETIVTAVEKSIDKALEKFQEQTVDDLLSGVSSFMSNLNMSFYTDSHQDIFAAYPVPQKAKNMINTFMNIALSGTDEANIRQQIESQIYGTFNVGVVSQFIDEIKNDFQATVDDAQSNFTGTIQSSLTDLLNGLIGAIQGLFNLDGFYNPEMNAFLSDAVMAETEAASNPFQQILDSINSLMAAATSFIEAISGLDFFAMLTAVKNLFDAVKSAISGLVTLVNQKITKITQVVGYFANDDLISLYDLFLMSSYVTYNLPNRTSNLSSDSALTGYAYSQIPFSQYEGVTLPVDVQGVAAVIQLIADMANGGSDEMFKGAELEYIVAGTQSELMNQAITFMDIYFIRMILDIPAVLTDPNVTSMAALFNIASWVILIIVIIGEPLVDTILLVNGMSVPIVKTSCYLTPIGIGKLLAKAGSESPICKQLSQSTLGQIPVESVPDSVPFTDPSDFLNTSYQTYCLLIIMFGLSEEEILERFSDIVQLEAAMYYKNTDESVFDLDEAYTTLETSSTFTFNSLFNFIDVGDSGSGLFTKTLTREHGY